jgi:hypothetical protein
MRRWFGSGLDAFEPLWSLLMQKSNKSCRCSSQEDGFSRQILISRSIISRLVKDSVVQVSRLGSRLRLGIA